MANLFSLDAHTSFRWYIQNLKGLQLIGSPCYMDPTWAATDNKLINLFIFLIN